MTETKTILIIDDEKDVCDALADALNAAGFTSLSALSGTEGIAMALKHKPDLILLDVMMPTIDGWQVLEELKKDSWGKEARVIFLTNFGDMENISRAVSAGSYGFLVKSDLKLEDVVKKVKEALR